MATSVSRRSGLGRRRPRWSRSRCLPSVLLERGSEWRGGRRWGSPVDTSPLSSSPHSAGVSIVGSSRGEGGRLASSSPAASNSRSSGGSAWPAWAGPRGVAPAAFPSAWAYVHCSPCSSHLAGGIASVHWPRCSSHLFPLGAAPGGRELAGGGWWCRCRCRCRWAWSLHGRTVRVRGRQGGPGFISSRPA